MKIEIHGPNAQSSVLSVAEMAAIAKESFDLKERVPGVVGKAFDLKAWYRNWIDVVHDGPHTEPTHLQVEGADEFQATIPWPELDQAAVLHELENGEPLHKGYPIRLYVPDGSSNCLNVKSLVKLFFVRDERLGHRAEFGFINRVGLNELRKR